MLVQNVKVLNRLIRCVTAPKERGTYRCRFRGPFVPVMRSKRPAPFIRSDRNLVSRRDLQRNCFGYLTSLAEALVYRDDSY